MFDRQASSGHALLKVRHIRGNLRASLHIMITLLMAVGGDDDATPTEARSSLRRLCKKW